VSSEPWEKVRDDSIACDEAVKRILGGKIKSPFMIMSFVGLVAVPDLGLTEKGLVDCRIQALMDVILDSVLSESPGIGTTVKLFCRCPSHNHNVHQMMDPEHSIAR